MKSNTTIPLARPKSRVFPLVAAIVLAGLASAASAQQQARQRPARAEPAEPAKDYNQRALEIYEFRKAAQSGPDRGQEIYFYKCWMCHNELAQGGAPKLVGLFKRPTLVTGDPRQRRHRQGARSSTAAPTCRPTSTSSTRPTSPT